MASSNCRLLVEGWVQSSLWRFCMFIPNVLSVCSVRKFYVYVLLVQPDCLLESSIKVNDSTNIIKLIPECIPPNRSAGSRVWSKGFTPMGSIRKFHHEASTAKHWEGLTPKASLKRFQYEPKVRIRKFQKPNKRLVKQPMLLGYLE